LDALKLGSMTIRENGRDVTQREIDRLVSVLAQHPQKNPGNAQRSPCQGAGIVNQLRVLIFQGKSVLI
jgi:hypothetical protein